MIVDAGELRHKIDIIAVEMSETPDGYPVEISSTVVRTARAKVSRQSGGEQLRAGAEVLREQVRFLIRWSRTTLDRTMRVRYDGREYDIGYINDYGDDHRYVELWCTRSTEREA